MVRARTGITRRSVLVGGLCMLATSCDRVEQFEGVCVEPPERPTETVIAGSGATLPLARELVALYQVVHPDRTIRLAESIGTSGALRAIADGAIDVGLASRAIDEESLSVLHLADATLEIAAHPDVRDNRVSWEFLLAAAEGEARWSNGTPVVFIHREPGDSGTRVLTSIAPDLSAAIDRGRERSLLVAYTDADALRQLTSVPGAIGLHDPVTTRLVGASVTAVSVADAPQWKRQLSVFWDRESGPPHFVEFLGTAAASGLVRTLGYEPYAQ